MRALRALIVLGVCVLGCRDYPFRGEKTDAGCVGASCVSACDGGTCPFGTPCTTTAECGEGICLSLPDDQSICSPECNQDEQCLPGWICASSPIQKRVCVCGPAESEICDGRDNDCNTLIDDQPSADSWCAQQLGEGAVCLSGSCVPPRCQSNADCPTREICDAMTGACIPAPVVLRVCLLDPMNGAVVENSCFPPGLWPPTVLFGSSVVGTTALRSIRVFNDGGQQLLITEAHIEPAATVFSLTEGTSISRYVNPGEYVDIQIQFAPLRGAEEMAVLDLPSNDVEHPLVQLPLVATGLDPQLCVSPDPVLFGALAVGSSRSLAVTLTNCGNADYHLLDTHLINPHSPVFSTTPVGSPGSLPAPGFDLPPGASISVAVTYTPVDVERRSSPGDTGYLAIRTEYQSLSVPLKGRGGSIECLSTGVDITPTPVITVRNGATVIDPRTTTVIPLTSLIFDASASTSPAVGGVNGYSWRLVSQPNGSVASLQGVGVRVGLLVEIIGDYVVELVAESGSRCLSDPVTVTIHVFSPAAIHVQLTWPEPNGDVDVHYVGPGGALYETTPYTTDLNWTNSLATAYGTSPPVRTGERSPDWGRDNTCAPDGDFANDASLDVDQRDGYGPENVTHDRPFDGTYMVAVHFYCAGGLSSRYVQPVLNIYVNGALAWHAQSRPLAQRQVWEAAQIVVSNHGTSIRVQPLSTAFYSIDEGC